MSLDDPNDVRYRPDDGCPIFSQALEDHIVAVSRGQAPNAGRFCGNCYTPIGRDTELCPHCREACDPAGRTGRKPVSAVPGDLLDILRVQRSIESKWVNGFAYLGILIAAVTGIAIVLWLPFFRDRLIWATVFYGTYLLIGSRVLPAILGGYYGDRMGFEKARAKTREAWAEWVAERDQPKRAKQA
ncbi:MAG: zinc ribbon domain-containing protein [Chloroflexi bacterium]|nr:zinc ribbon domain-containing protein [Chloroflexota bacterium]